MASQELYTSVVNQIEQAMARLSGAVGNLEWQAASREAAIISELAVVADQILAEVEDTDNA